MKERTKEGKKERKKGKTERTKRAQVVRAKEGLRGLKSKRMGHELINIQWVE